MRLSVESESKELSQNVENASLVQRFLNYLKKKEYYTAWMAFTTFFYELRECFKYLFRMPFGRKRHFNYYGLNPKELTEEQREHDPILLLHGNYCNASNWFSVAKKLQKEYKGPVFTVNLKSGKLSQQDVETIDARISHIKNLYGGEVVTHLSGFSRGSRYAYWMSLNRDNWHIKEDGTLHYEYELRYRTDIGRVVMIGAGDNPFGYKTNSHLAYKFRYIEAANDAIWTKTLDLRKEHRADIESGHAALINKKETHKQLCRWFNEVSQYTRSKERVREEIIVQAPPKCSSGT